MVRTRNEAAWYTPVVPGHPRLHDENLNQKKKQGKKIAINFYQKEYIMEYYLYFNKSILPEDQRQS